MNSYIAESSLYFVFVIMHQGHLVLLVSPFVIGLNTLNRDLWHIESTENRKPLYPEPKSLRHQLAVCRVYIKFYIATVGCTKLFTVCLMLIKSMAAVSIVVRPDEVSLNNVFPPSINKPSLASSALYMQTILLLYLKYRQNIRHIR